MRDDSHAAVRIPQRRRRIALLINRLARGGAETQCVRLAIGLHERGYRVRVLTLLPSLAHTAELAHAGIPVLSSVNDEHASPLSMASGLFAHLREYQPDVLLTFLYQANLAGRLLGRIAGVPAIVTSIRNEYFGGSDRPANHPSVLLRERSIRWTHSLASLTTTNSDVVRSSLVRRGIVGPDAVVVPNMIGDDAFEMTSAEARRAVREEFATPAEAFVWINVARLFRQKDHATLFQAFRALLDKQPDSRLWVVGGGELAEPLKEMAIRLEIDNHVHFAGERADVHRLLQAADGFVLSSQWEGLPNVLIEAGAAGLPLVSTAVGGVSEILPDSGREYLIEPGNARALSAAMLRVQHLPLEQVDEYGRSCRDHVRERFGSTAVLDQWELVLETAVRKGTKKGP